MNPSSRPWLAALCMSLACWSSPALAADAGADWPQWRGPHQSGVSDETGLPSKWDPAKSLWVRPVPGRGAPVVVGEKVYSFGYIGEGQELQEVLACLDAATGKELWSHAFNDYLSDVIYSRYTIGSPAVDPATGNVFMMSSAGTFACFTADGKPVWQRSLMEEIGRMTFPNGRTGGPVVHGDLVIFHFITSNWGGDGPAKDRFYAYDKANGLQVWSCTPGIRPKDNSFATPVFAKYDGHDALFCGTGCGNVACIDCVTGKALWRYPVSKGGINSSLLLYGDDKLIVIHGKENIDGSGIGRLMCIKRNAKPAPPAKPVEGAPAAPPPEGAPLLDRSCEVWRNDELSAFSSSPVLVGDRIYLTNEIGELVAVDAATGKRLWIHKLGVEQLHASPLYADGKLYVPIKDKEFFILKPDDKGAEVLDDVKLDGECLAAPSVAHGRVYVQTTAMLYCFGAVRPAGATPAPAAPALRTAALDEIVRLQVEPYEILMRTGTKQPITVRGVTAAGEVVALPKDAKPTWAKYIPPTAKVKSTLNAEMGDDDVLVAAEGIVPSAGMFKATLGKAEGFLRGRILGGVPIHQDFEGFACDVPHATEKDVKFSYPPLPWIGARFKWEVRDLVEADGSHNKVLTKTTDNTLFQRAWTFIGLPESKDYTIEADVRSDGNRRKMSEVGIICQRYVIALTGNAQELEISSTLERLRDQTPFAWTPDTWYHLKARVDVAADGSGVIRAKAWKKGDPEPAAWTREVHHQHANREGSPGVYGFSPTEMRVYVDNVNVVPSAP